MLHLTDQERAFGSNVLNLREAKAFFRRWRKRDWSQPNAWGRIRDASYVVNGREVKGLRLIGALRRHLVELQDNRCCYCRRRLQGTAYARPIEHVLPKKHYPQFTFHYRNLAVSCYDCNSAKSDTNWSTWPDKKRKYIAENRCGEFFHPRFHDYDQHIRYLRMDTNGASVSAYFGLTIQGKHLCQALLTNAAGQEVELGGNPRLANALDRLKDQIDSLDERAVAGDLATFLLKIERLAFHDVGQRE